MPSFIWACPMHRPLSAFSVLTVFTAACHAWAGLFSWQCQPICINSEDALETRSRKEHEVRSEGRQTPDKEPGIWSIILLAGFLKKSFAKGTSQSDQLYLFCCRPYGLWVFCWMNSTEYVFINLNRNLGLSPHIKIYTLYKGSLFIEYDGR